MAGFIGFGDIFRLTKLAATLYDYGWNEKRNCSRQYYEFGRDVEALHQSLENLAEVIENADRRLLEFPVPRNAKIRCDPLSLAQIIGDCRQTIVDCDSLLQRNSRFAHRGGPIQSIEWNSLIQGDVEALQKRIQQHASKIQLALAPLEIDLLSRIHQDLQAIRSDLADIKRTIDIMHDDVLRLRGVVVTDLRQGLAQQEVGGTFTIQVPLNVAFAFDSAYVARSSPSLSDLADVFVLYFYQSTYGFSARTALARDRVPSDAQYLNLLKCIWLLQKIKASDEFQAQRSAQDSHWPSYVQELGKVVSEECRRFERELTIPERPSIDGELVAIWPPELESRPLDEIQKDEMIEKVLETTIKHASEDRMLSLQLLRRLEAGSNEFRVNISGDKKNGGGHIMSIDFNLTTTTLTPHYVVDWRPPYDMIVETGLRMTSLHFMELKEVMKFQHATTGYQVLGYRQFHVDVKFVFSSQREPVPVHKACAQIWIPLRREGSLSTTSGSQMDGTSAERSSNASSAGVSQLRTASPFLPQGAFGADMGIFRERQDSVWDRSTRSQGAPFQQACLGSTSHFPDLLYPPAREPRSSSVKHSVNSYPSPEPSSPSKRHWRAGSGAGVPDLVSSDSGRTSAMSTLRPPPTASTTRSSSSGSSRTLLIDTGAGTGVIHIPPAKPMLVLLTQDTRNGLRSMVTVDLATTDVNPERCYCCRADARGRDCCEVALERSDKEGKPLDARRFQPLNDKQPDWDVSRLAFSRQADPDAKKAQWKDLTRVTITFLDPVEKNKFAGGWCDCKNRGASRETAKEYRTCVTRRHRGLLGEAKLHYLDMVAEDQEFLQNRQQVVTYRHRSTAR